MAMAKSKSKKEENLAKFAEMVIRKMEEISSDWKQPWVNVKGKMPQNLSGRHYHGSNTLMLMMLQEKEGYELPVYMTYKQAKEEGIVVKKGEHGFPIALWESVIKNKETGEKITYEDYKKLSREEQEKYTVKPFTKFYHVFNVEQTTMKEMKPERWEELEARFKVKQEMKDDTGKLKCPELDQMLENQTWLCPIRSIESNQAFYSPGKDEITIPLKEQFEDGEEFYLTELHEMAHSTGAEGRLDRNLKGGKFGNDEYAREELVAELTSAIVASNIGISPTINKNNIAYLNSWTKTLRENPKVILTVLGDAAKSAELIQKTVLGEEALQEMEESTGAEIDDTTEKTEVLKEGPKNNVSDMENENEKKTLKDGVSVFKMNSGMYGINVVKDGERSATKKLSKEDVQAYFDGLKGQPKEEVDRRREELAAKYFSNAQNQEQNNAQKVRTAIKPLPTIDGTTRERIDRVSIFKMQDGKNYCVRAKIDGEQQLGVRVHPADIRAFFDGFKELSKEEQEGRKAELAAKYYKDELESPAMVEKTGMRR